MEKYTETQLEIVVSKNYRYWSILEEGSDGTAWKYLQRITEKQETRTLRVHRPKPRSVVLRYVTLYQ
jgi:hypothetical protein